ncbi:MAG TPA: YeeE/YedE family protein [Accumulibacter sp.]|nr:YeeE/YedE family protein [Accumulibacter sp.]
MLNGLGPHSLVVALAFIIGGVFGAVAQRTRFCAMGAIADIVLIGDWRRMRMWLLAIGVAIIGSALLHASGQIDLGKSIYRTPNFTWLSYLIGGLCFGFGMVLASGCGARTLVRLGAGSLKSLVVLLVLGVVAYMTLRGILGVLRVSLLEKIALYLPAGQDLPSLLGQFGVPPLPALAGCALLLGGGALLFAGRYGERLSLVELAGGSLIGLLVVVGWYVSGHLGYLAEDPETLQEAFVATNSGRMESLSFVAPIAYTLDWLLLWSDSSRQLTFAIASSIGVVVGSGCQARLSGDFRWEGFGNLEDTANHLIGAALMGFGGVLAMGCTIGQGISGLSTLAAGSLLTFLAIVAGARLAFAYQLHRALA